MLVIGVAAPLGLMKIDLTEEAEDFNTVEKCEEDHSLGEKKQES